MLPSDPRETLLAPGAAKLAGALEELRADRGLSGRAWCTTASTRVDRALGASAQPWRAVVTAVATGGYGRRELCPGSDVDLLVLHDGLDEPGQRAALRDLLYPLWDAGLTVGHALHTPQSLGAVTDVETVTSVLDARVVAGDPDRLRPARDRILGRLRRAPRRILEAITHADMARRHRAGDSAESLEPDLKRGAGGLRDVQSLRWAAAALVGEVELDALVPAAYVGAEDRPRLARAYDRLLAVRVELHRLSGRRGDVLRLDVQQQVALELGYTDGHDDGDTAAHRLMTDVFRATRAIDHVHRRAWALIAADAVAGRRRRRPARARVDGFELADGGLRLADGADLLDPRLPTRLLRVLTEQRAVLDRRTATALRRACDRRVIRPRWTPAARRELVACLLQGQPVLSALAELDDCGLLVAVVPEWAPVQARAQRHPRHRFSLDRHGWHAVAELGELVRREAWAATALEHVDDREALVLATLLHDIGKAHGEPHSQTGAPVAQAVARRLGASGPTVELVGRLVRHHLLLVWAATRRDLTDPCLAAQLAAAIEDRQTLACLQLLTAADGRATGPGAWSPWTASLVQTLVDRVRDAMADDGGSGLRTMAADTATEAARIAADMGSSPAAVRAHMALLPARYAAALAPRSIVRHTALAATRPAPGEIRTRVTPDQSIEPTDPQGAAVVFDRLDVVALDTPRLFSKVVGVLSLHGGSILGADAFTRDDGIAVDTFMVVRPPEATPSWAVRVEGDLHEAVAGRLALRARVAVMAPGRRPDRGPQVATRVEIGRDSAGQASVVEVRTEDRRGVLFHVASALGELELDLIVARVQTLGHEVVDTFTVRTAAGGPMDADHAAELELALRHALTQGAE